MVLGEPDPDEYLRPMVYDPSDLHWALIRTMKRQSGSTATSLDNPEHRELALSGLRLAAADAN
jgi:hypothetical protein